MHAVYLFSQVNREGCPPSLQKLAAEAKAVLDKRQENRGKDAPVDPGMKILQFAFDSGDTNEYLPHTFDSHSVVYTGTHDNDTVHGWYAGASPGDREHARAYLNSSGEEIHWDFIRTALASVSRLAVVPMQDVLGLGTDARMNVPGTTGGNWRWRITGDQLADTATVRRLRSLTELYGRLA